MQFLQLSNPKQNNLGAGVLKINYPVSENSDGSMILGSRMATE
jgi:hypothetical protein